MGIKYRPEGEARTKAELGLAVGQAQKSKEASQRASQKSQRYAAAKRQTDLQKMRAQLQDKAEKAKLQRQAELQAAQEQQSEQRQEERIALEDRARQWEMEKMEARSMQDFEMQMLRTRMKEEQDIKLELKQHDQYQQAAVTINELKADGKVNDEQASTMLARAKMKSLGMSGVVPSYESQQRLGMAQDRQQNQPGAMFNLGDQAPQGTTAVGANVDPILKLHAGSELSDMQLDALVAQMGVDKAKAYAQQYNLR